MKKRSKSEHKSPALTAEEDEVLKSATRWHRNSHYSEDDWIRSFNSISGELNVRGKMKVPQELRVYRRTKTKSLKEQFILMPELLECLDTEIKEKYSNLLQENREDPEYDFGHAISGEDQLFYTNFFAPIALLKAYMNLHTDLKITDCLPELFKIGGNSKTSNLSPEVTVLCSLCSDESDETILQINRIVIQNQFAHKFTDPKFFKLLHFNSLSDEIENLCCFEDHDGAKHSDDRTGRSSFLSDDEPLVQSVESAEVRVKINKLEEATKKDHFPEVTNSETVFELKKTQEQIEMETSENHIAKFESESNDIEEEDFCLDIYNPFSSKVDLNFTIFNPFIQASGEENDDKIFLCDMCSKQFSDSEFVTMHKKLFHKMGHPEKRLKLKYVEMADTSIKSLVFDNNKRNVQIHSIMNKKKKCK